VSILLARGPYAGIPARSKLDKSESDLMPISSELESSSRVQLGQIRGAVPLTDSLEQLSIRLAARLNAEVYRRA
jgi:hypothetical protein